MQDGLLLHSVASVLAGTVATSKSFFASCDVIPSCSLRFLSAITAPADVLRSRLMAAVRYASILVYEFGLMSLSYSTTRPTLSRFSLLLSEKRDLDFCSRVGPLRLSVWDPTPF